MNARPFTPNRPATANRSSAGGRQTASILQSSNNNRVPMWPLSNPRATSRASTNWGPLQGLPLNSTINVVDRPMTQQGLGGLKTSSRLPQRNVQDKSYFLGLLHTKSAEVQREIKSLVKENEQLSSEQQDYRSSEMQASDVALQLKLLQEELADYNALVDKLSTNTEIEDFKWESQQMKQENDQKMKANEELFATKYQKEAQLQKLEKEIEEEKRFADGLLANMGPELREKFKSLSGQCVSVRKEMERMQSEIDELDSKKSWLEKEVSAYHIKWEAYCLQEKLHSLDDKYETVQEEEKLRNSPAKEREKLLKQVKEDNQEISTMERHIKEIKEKIGKLNEEREQLDRDLDIAQSERNQQYLELKKREEMMDQFLSQFDEGQNNDKARIKAGEERITELLEKISLNVTQCEHLPTTVDLKGLQDDLSFKESELEKGKSTVKRLGLEHQRLKAGLLKMDELETKMKLELESTKEKIEQMKKELAVFQDIDGLRKSEKDKEQQLLEKHASLTAKDRQISDSLAKLQQDHDRQKKLLEENEAHIQLSNLERKWQHLEQNNFLMKEFIANKQAQTNYTPIIKSVNMLLAEHNTWLQSLLSKR